MVRFVAKKFILAALTLLGASMLTFALGRLAPGDPVETLLSGIQNPTLEDIEIARAYLQLDRPLHMQYMTWLGRVLQGDLGWSYRTHVPVLHEISVRLPATMKLMLGSLAVMLLFGFALGIASALKQDKPLDYAIRFFNTLVIAIPAFCLGILLLMVFAVRLGWLPVIPTGNFDQLVLPSITIGVGAGAGLSRLVRSQMITAMQKEHVRAALAFGVSRRRVIVNNVLKNAMPPIVTNIGLFAGALLGGSAIIETLFSWPGAGRYAVDAIFGRDYPVIQAYALIMAALYIAINLLTDLVNCAFAPSSDILGVSGDG